MNTVAGVASNASAREEPFVQLYSELRALAQWHLQSERPDHTLQSTALVHEAYLRLSTRSPDEWADRKHFLSVAAKVMRQILVDHARTRNRLKRGAARERITLVEVDAALKTSDPIDIQLVDRALDRLAELDSRQAQIRRVAFLRRNVHSRDRRPAFAVARNGKAGLGHGSRMVAPEIAELKV